MSARETLASAIADLKQKIAGAETAGGDTAAADRKEREEIRAQMMTLRLKLVEVQKRLQPHEPRDLLESKRTLADLERQLDRLDRTAKLEADRAARAATRPN